MSNTTKHTPGPWHIASSIDPQTRERALAVWQKALKEGQIGNPVCLVSPVDKMTLEDNANARLIAAAPDLLELLTELYERNQIKVFIPIEVSKRMKAAIAKATAK